MSSLRRIPARYLSELIRDLRYAVRTLRASPGFALVAILSIAIGIGLTTMLYDTKWQMLSRELPRAANASRLVMPEKSVSYDDVDRFRAQTQLFTGVAAFQTGVAFKVVLDGDASARAQRVFGQLVSPDYFAVLGVRAQAGRLLSADIDRPGDAPVVVISDRFWRHRLGAAPNAVGRMLRLNGRPAVIVGIAPKDFQGAMPLTGSELFVPTTVTSALAPELGNDVLHRADAKEFSAIMCLRPGVTLESAEAALDVTVRHLEEQRGDPGRRIEKGRRVTLLPAGTMVPIPQRMRPAVLGFVAVLMALIMSIACMNLANLLLARGASRRRELAIRLAVGASRFRLVRQMVTEGVVLALLGGVAGFGLGYGLTFTKAKLVAAAPGMPERIGGLDWHTATFALLLSVVCGIGLSVLPAWRVTRTDVTPALKGGSALQLPAYRRLGVRNILMAGQVMGSLVLLLVTGFLVLGIRQSSRVQTSFDPRTMFLAGLDPVRDGYSAEQATAFFDKLPARLKTVGAVRAVALAAQPPFTLPDEDAGIQFTADEPIGATHTQITGFTETIGAGYFTTLNESMLSGREFVERDERLPADASTRLPAVLNETAAHALFGGGSALGKRFHDDGHSYEVVGVARDFKLGTVIGRSMIYRPLSQREFRQPPASGLTLILRADAGRDAMAGMRREIASIDPRLTVFDEQTLNDYLERSRAPQRFSVMTYGAIGVFALILSAMGLAGVTAYAVAQRRREIGIRMALGARQTQVLGLVLREGAALIAVGTAMGLAGAFLLARMLSALTSVFVSSLEIGATDLRLLIGAPVLLAALALGACYIPARRAAKTDPLITLRQG